MVTIDDRPVLLDIAGGHAVITLNRPAAYNALNLSLTDGFLDALITCDQDQSVRAVLITGNGPAFCAGGDIRQMQDAVEARGNAGAYLKMLTVRFHGVISTIAQMRKPVVTGVNGVAAGGGLSVALAGDIVVASDAARFTVAYTGIGAVTDGGLSFHLPRLVGPKLAFELTCSNRTLSAQEAKDLHIVSHIYPHNEFLERAKAYVAHLATLPTEALAHAKRLYAVSAGNGLETQMEQERQAISACGRTADFAEGVEAFLAKRKARFIGR
ncbi:MAG TPA: enoyl-CoA hydratase/isomerase family protein [Rhizomicrobium sp.]|jgi:2-(1,2-epoxy-1,2-dihydrophenyl)acetyl-CoA isomerase|nr:enoyl-CoA hydratase/isomerase family protein [Rhizomicrobium sp.]